MASLNTRGPLYPYLPVRFLHVAAMDTLMQ